MISLDLGDCGPHGDQWSIIVRGRGNRTLTPAIWPANVTNSDNPSTTFLHCATVQGVSSTDSHRSPYYIIFDGYLFGCKHPSTRQYNSTMTMRTFLIVAFLLARFHHFFRCSLGLINRLNPYTVRESYLNRGSYKGNESKRRSREVNNKTCAYYVGMTPLLLYCRIPYCHIRT